MIDNNPWAARAGWSADFGASLPNSRKGSTAALLDRIESEMGSAASEGAMDHELLLSPGVGIHFPEASQTRAIAIGEEALGSTATILFRRACTSLVRADLDQRDGEVPSLTEALDG